MATINTNKNLMKYGDEYHRSLGGRLDPRGPVVTWCKEGYVRANLTTPSGRVVPIWDYDAAAEAAVAGEPLQK